MTLATIREAFDKARREATAGAKHNPLDPTWSEKQVCAYCGEWWRKWPGSKLDGHAACIVPSWFKEHLRTELAPRADITFTEVSKALGVSISVVRAWCTKRR